MRMAIVLSLLLAACTAPSTQADGTATVDAAPQEAIAGAPQAGVPARTPPPLSDPLPPERVQGYCDADADCSMRPGRAGCMVCASRSDIAAPDAQAGAGKDCGPQQTECRCVEHRCQARPLLIDSPVETTEQGTP